MEENLNLAELLRGCEGEKVFMPDEGEAEIIVVGASTMTLRIYGDNNPTILDPETLKIMPTGFAYVYPSSEAFAAYPLDARKAWLEWAENRKPERWWRAGDGLGYYWYINRVGKPSLDQDVGHTLDNCRYGLGNYFRTEALAQQAAEAVKKCFADFHNSHNTDKYE